MRKRATIFDVAEAAGVSIKTVSRVLNREPNVRQSTAERVLSAVGELNYSPSFSARGLASNRSFLVGLVYDKPTGDNNFVPDIQAGALEVCLRQRYELLIHPVDTKEPEVDQQLLSLSRRLRIDGLIVLPPLSDNRSLLSALADAKIQFARISQSFARSFGPCVSVDDEEAAKQLTEYLISLGHRRIGFVGGKPTHGASVDRLKGYTQALQGHGITYRKSLVNEGDFSFETGRDVGRKLLKLSKPPTAIFAANDDMASGVLVAARERGVDVPGQLSVCGYDDISLARQTWPPLTTVRQPIREVAGHAAQLLIDKLNGKPVDDIRLHSELIVRESTGPAPT